MAFFILLHMEKWDAILLHFLTHSHEFSVYTVNQGNCCLFKSKNCAKSMFEQIIFCYIGTDKNV